MSIWDENTVRRPTWERSYAVHRQSPIRIHLPAVMTRRWFPPTRTRPRILILVANTIDERDLPALERPPGRGNTRVFRRRCGRLSTPATVTRLTSQNKQNKQNKKTNPYPYPRNPRHHATKQPQAQPPAQNPKIDPRIPHRRLSAKFASTLRLIPSRPIPIPSHHRS